MDTPTGELSQVIDKYAEVFAEGLGILEGVTAEIYVDPQKPRFHKARPIPYALKEKVDMELERLQREGVLEPAEFSQWAAPVVPVLKEDGSVRLCGDYRTTVNQVLERDSYPYRGLRVYSAHWQGAILHEIGSTTGIPTSSVR